MLETVFSPAFSLRAMSPYAAPKTKNILIIGSTGTIGTYITRAIVDNREHFERICVLTSEKTLVQKVQDIAALEAWGVEIFTGRLESESAVKRAYEGMSHSRRCSMERGRLQENGAIAF